MVKPRNEWNQTTKTKQNEWRKKNRALLGSDMSKQEADQFRTLCKDQGISVSAALSQFVRAAIQAGTLDIIRDDIPWTRDGDDFTRDGRAAGDNCRDDPPGQKNHDPAFPQGDQASENDTPGSVDGRPVSDTPGTV